MAIRPISDQDFRDYYQIMINAYPDGRSDEEAEIQKYVQERTDSQNAAAQPIFYGCFRHEKLQGVMSLLDQRMRVLSQTMPIIGLSGVAVDIFHRKEKVAKELMDGFLQICRQREISFGALAAFRVDFYREMGWGIGSKLHKYRLKPGGLPKGPTREHIRFLTANDRKAFVACYQRYFEQTHGLFEKTDDLVDKALEESHYYKTVGVVKDGTIEGYCSFFFDMQNPNQMNLIVREFVYHTPEAISELLTFFQSLADQVETIIWPTPDDQLHHLLFDSPGSSASLELDAYMNQDAFSTYHRSNESGLIFMYRIFDSAGFFRDMAGHDFGGQTCRLKLTTIDTMIPENNDSVCIQFSEGFPTVITEDNTEVEIRLDVAHLSSLVMGTVNFTNLCRYGLAHISEPQYVPTIDRLFATSQQPLYPRTF